MNWKNKWGIKTIQTDLMASFLALIVFTISIIGLLSYKLAFDAVESNARENTQQIVNQVDRNIEYYIAYMQSIADVALMNTDITEYLMKLDFHTESVLNEYKQRIINQFNHVLNARGDISSIIIFGNEGRNVMNRSNVLNPFVDPKQQGWYQDALRAEGKSIISAAHVQTILKDEYNWVVSLSRKLTSTDGKNTFLGVLLVDLNYKVITDICNGVQLGRRGYVFIVDRNGRIVYHPQQQLIYNKLKTENIPLVLQMDNGSVSVRDHGEGKMYSVTSSKDTGWKIVGVSYLDEMVHNRKEIQLTYFFGGAGCLLIALFISLFLSRRIAKPIKQLEASMKNVQKGNFDTVVDIREANEIGALSRAFNRMTYEIQELLKQNTLVQEMKRKSELQALQAQINPHFLYNTLDSIIWMAEGKKMVEVITMTYSLSKLFRLSISKGTDITPLADEIEHIRSYLNIQKIRYGDHLDFEIDIDPDLHMFKVLKVMLQPIVENAIYHGIKNKQEKGKIMIHGFRDEARLLLQISDNGVGMSSEQLDNVFKNKERASKGGGIGVRNVDERIKLYYGNSYGLHIESEYDVGTTVYMTLPIIE
ncbi:hypothetical protein BC351_18715 [Paenibacillus ferrarius]|uniref:histidine kinase n=1 Tax=Paenibacillus ferrarius TaxID=1469647 RepID=A0A1V4HPP2_9BACL|nr:sensor histidine kinase [Paenibacillus ferrarius]OPH59956.1 hypothetical protein BC351_18715 [Paenibacillus ferrarius]